jgi:hypothetical protein
MGNFAYGFKVLWRVWRDEDFAAAVRELEGKSVAGGEPPTAAPVTQPPTRQKRSEALTLLAVLQREGRLVDFLQEPISAYSDAQVGAAVRDVHKGCAAVLERLFELQPLAPAAEGAQVEVPKGYDPIEYRLTGNVTGTPPYHGTLFHPGWKAGKSELPEWTGTDASTLVVAPAEVEVK